MRALLCSPYSINHYRRIIGHNTIVQARFYSIFRRNSPPTLEERRRELEEAKIALERERAIYNSYKEEKSDTKDSEANEKEDRQRAHKWYLAAALPLVCLLVMASYAFDLLQDREEHQKLQNQPVFDGKMLQGKLLDVVNRINMERTKNQGQEIEQSQEQQSHDVRQDESMHSQQKQ
jgi:hypothetical protein